ncbi:transcriptional regulator [Micromonospora sp. STR1s_5]|nr:transcriptional regulator [Micromonospora sp. STR1s_5]
MHQRVRLGILTAPRVEFGRLPHPVSADPRQPLPALACWRTPAWVQIEKRYASRRGWTWITLTDVGDSALAEEIARLKLLMVRVGTTETLEDR